MNTDKNQKDILLKKAGATVIDTTAVLIDPDIFYHLQGRLVIPSAVIKELDGLKRGDDDAAYSARKAARTLDILGSYEEEFGIKGNLAEGVQLSTGGIVQIYSSYEVVDALDSEADNRIVGTALKLKNEGIDVILKTADINMRNVARGYKIKVQSCFPESSPKKSEATVSPRSQTYTAIKNERVKPPTCLVKNPTTPFALKKRGAGYDKKYLSRLSPIYWIRKVLQCLFRDRGDNLFWSMDVDEYRALMEYRDCIESDGKINKG